MPPAIVLMQLSARPVPMIVESEALQMMKEGDKWRLIVTPELGYGAHGSGPIPGNTTLIFEVELIAVR